jgi:hypothetical protein
VRLLLTASERHRKEFSGGDSCEGYSERFREKAKLLKIVVSRGSYQLWLHCFAESLERLTF